MIPIGRGAGAGTDTVDEMPWTYHIFRERADGPKWAACLREGRKLRERAALPSEFVRTHRLWHDRQTLFAACDREPCVGNQAELEGNVERKGWDAALAAVREATREMPGPFADPRWIDRDEIRGVLSRLGSEGPP